MQAPFEQQSIVLPHNVEAEQALLGAILFSNRAYDLVADLLLPEHFAQGVHGRIFAAIQTLIGRNEIASPVTLKGLFDQDESLNEVGGSAYLAKLSTSVVTVMNAADYGRTIYEAWLRRQLIAHSLGVIEKAQAFSLEPDAARVLLEDAEQELYRLGERRAAGDGPVSAARASFRHVSDVEKAYQAGGKPIGLATGLRALDGIIGGLHDGELIVLGGRPGMGKSLIAGRIAWNIARRDPARPVGIWSLEQSERLWVARWLASTTGISTDRQYAGQLEEPDWPRFLDADQDLRKMPLAVDEAGALTVGQLRHRARRLDRQYRQQGHDDGLGLVVADHLGLMRASPATERAGPVAIVSEVSRDLKALAKDLKRPVLALSQLNRGVENRDDKRPNLADLRQSGSIEQDADIVIFVYRHAYYLERSPPQRRQDESAEAFDARYSDHQEELARCRHMAELIVAKNRHGPIGAATMFIDMERCIIEDLHRGAGE